MAKKMVTRQEVMRIKIGSHFTIEVIIQPASGGNFVQRFLHCGEVQGDRVMFELRSTLTNWHFNAFIKAGDSQQENFLVD